MGRLISLWTLLAYSAAAQILTGSLSGTVQDSSGLAVAGAEVALLAGRTGQQRNATTAVDGTFVFSGLEAGVYTVTVSKDGFKRFTRTNLNLVSGERLALGVSTLEVGAVSDSISVRAEGARVQTESSDRSAVITSAQVDGLLIQGRNPTSLVGLLPGVVVSSESASLDRDTNFNVMGNRRTANNITIDGVPTVDADNGFSQKLNVNMDAVAEVQVLLSNYQAEYGRNAGSNVNIVTRSGTRQFHGLGSYFKRHEQFNANNFFNNFTGTGRPRYRYNTWTYNVGGPVLLPGRFNAGRDKLFFFWSQEFWPITQGQTRRVTVPEAGERTGDFSQSRDVNNALIVIRDPQASAAFPGNRIPASRLDASGNALLRNLPAANFQDRSVSRGNYNYVFTSENETPKRSDLLKVDYNLNPNNQFYVTWTGFNEVAEGEVGSTGTTANWPQMRLRFAAPNKSLAGRYTRVISPRMVNEFQMGWLRNFEKHTVSDTTLKANQREAIGFTAGQFVPASNPLGIVPNATFGGVPSAANYSVNGRFPADNRYDVVTFTDKLSWVSGAHTVKAGFFYEWNRRDVNQNVAFNGAIDFGRNAANPLDSGYAYSNAALGVFNSYSEPTARPRFFGRVQTFESFVQDTWKLNRRVTLEAGLRVYWMPPVYGNGDLIAGFVPARFDAARAVRLIRPGLQGTTRVGIDAAGTVYPATLIGAFTPRVGDPGNGMVVAANDQSYPRALMASRGPQWAPRFGLSWDPFGDGKTAVRLGGGLFYNRLNLNAWVPLTAQPPLVNTPTVNFNTLANLRTAAGLLFPSNAQGMDREGKVPLVMNYSLSVQRNLGWGTVVETAYVAALGRHLFWQRDVNPIPLGANFNPANFDSTLAGGRPLPPQFLRPYVGYNQIAINEPAGSSSYHSLQVTANRRFARGLQAGLAWTWSKAMDFNSNDLSTVSALSPVRVWNYGLADHDRTHVVKINWLYDVPGPGSSAAGWLRQTLGGWQLSGIASFVSGAPLGVGVTTVVATDLTGTASQNARSVMLANPVLPKDQRTFYRFFNTSAFGLPAVGTFGNAARSLMRGPGVNNFDAAVFKNFPLRESVRLQFRGEFYNAFNHTQFSAVDTTARFDAQGRQVSGQFGQMTAARDPRQIQFALRLYF